MEVGKYYLITLDNYQQLICYGGYSWFLKQDLFQPLADNTVTNKHYNPGLVYYPGLKISEFPHEEISLKDFPLFIGWNWVHPILADLIKGEALYPYTKYN
jgi:hypothetical protein